MNTLSEISSKIIETLKTVGRTEYFYVYSTDGEKIKIRVGDHSANRSNNKCKTLSFITNRTTQNDSAFNAMVNEWEVDLETEYTDTYETIEDVLENEGISNNQEEAEELYFEII